MNIASLARKFVIAAFVVFLHHVPQIAIWLEVNERYCDWWGPRYPLWIVLGVAVLAAAAVGLEWLAVRLGPVCKRIFDHLFLLALASGLLAVLGSLLRAWAEEAQPGALARLAAWVDEQPGAFDGLWCLALLLIAGSLFWRRSPLVRWGAVLCLIFSPLAPILVGQMCTWHCWSASLDPLPAAQEADAAGTPVLVFVFDEWSWLRSTEQGQWIAAMPNVRKLCQQAILFRDARSPGEETMQSLPEIIFQTDRRFVVRDSGTFFAGKEGETPCAQSASLFLAGRAHNYRSCLLGFHHPYRHVLDGQVDCCRCYSTAPADRGVLAGTVNVLLENARYWTDPLSRRFGPALLDGNDAENWYRMGRRYRQDMLAVLRECRGRSVVLFHVPAPHAPYVFNPDGSYHGPDAGLHDVEGYLRQLGHVDALVGQVVATLRQSGQFDRALVVLTSDHGWRFDPDPAFKRLPDWKRRVPLVVKLPGQRGPLAVDRTFCNNELMPLLEAVFAGQTNAGRLRESIGLGGRGDLRSKP